MKKENKPIFYLRKSRRSLSKKQKKLIQINLKKYLFKESMSNVKDIFLEIGFGYGENIINLAKKNKNRLILGNLFIIDLLNGKFKKLKIKKNSKCKNYCIFLNS